MQDGPWVHNLHSVQNMNDAFLVWESDTFKKKKSFFEIFVNRVRTNISTSKIRPEYLYVAVIAFNFACFAFKKT